MENIKKIFLTSDWHIGHSNCLKFDERPFNDLDHMEQVLINNFNSTVPEDGLTYVLGDVGMGSFERIKNFVSQLNGTKILIMGNHDGSVTKMYRIGFDCVMYNAGLFVAGNYLTMSHCPLQGVWREDTTGMRGATEGENWHKEQTNTKFSIQDVGQFHCHGHIHSREGKSDVILGKQWDVGVVGNDYRPVSLKRIEQWVQKCRSV